MGRLCSSMAAVVSRRPRLKAGRSERPPLLGPLWGEPTGAGVEVAIGAGTGVGVAEGAIVNGGRVGGIITIGALHGVVRNRSLIKVTVPFRASALP